MKYAIALLLLTLVACDYFKLRRHEHEPNPSPAPELELRAKEYCALGDEIGDAWGFTGATILDETGVRFRECGDMVGFNSLRAISCPDSIVDIAAAEIGESGAWDRDAAHACFDQGRTAARDSRDMILMRLFWIWQNSRLDLIERMIANGEGNGWIVCEAKDELTRLDRCRVTGALKALMYEVRFRLGGADSSARRDWSIESPIVTGYQAHLGVLSVYLRGLMFKGITDAELAFLRQQADREPQNQLYQAVMRKFTDGDQGAVVTALETDGKYFPLGRLPASSERCEPYLWQRDADGSGWQPCPEKGEIFPAVDFVFVSAVVLDRIRVNSQAGLIPMQHEYVEFRK